MPIRWAVATGNWSNTATWNSGATLGIPTGSDDAFAGGFTVTLDQDINVISLNTIASGSAPAGGSFSVTGSRNIVTSTMRAGSANCLNITGTSTLVNITGSISGSDTTNNIYTLNITSTSSSINVSGSIAGGPRPGSNVINLLGISNTVNVNGSVRAGAGLASNAYGILAGGTFNTVNITGSISGGSAGNNTWAVVISGIGTSLNVSGSVNGGTGGNSSGIVLDGTATGVTNIRVIGDISGSVGGVGLTLNRGSSSPYIASIVGTIAAFNFAGIVTSGGTLSVLNITGSVIASSIISQPGIEMSTTANLTLNISGSVVGSAQSGINTTGNFNTINVNGTVTAGFNTSGISSTANSTIIVSGSAIAATAGSVGSSPAISNTGTGQVIVGTAVASTINPAINNTGATPVIYEAMTIATNGRLPIVGAALLRQGNNNFISCSLDTTGYKTLINVNNISNGLPAASDVRRGTSYNFGDTTGSMAVPSASYVDSGVAVGNTSGTGVYTTASLLSTVWNTNVSALTASNSVGERLRNISTVSSTGDQLVALL